MRGFVAEYGVGAFEHVADEDGEIWATYGVTSQPAFVFIDDSGASETLIASLGSERLTEKIEELLS